MKGTIRPAQPKDAFQAAPLIIETGHDTIRIAFGSLDKGREVLSSMFQFPNNMHSFQYSTVYELDGKVAGLLLGYGRKESNTSFFPSLRLLMKSMGMRMGGLLRIQTMMGSIEPDSFYVHVLSVSPQFRGHGIGVLLMQEAERLARKHGKSRISLLVETRNLGAIKFYAREGYRIIKPRFDKALFKRMGFAGYLKMSKPLNGSDPTQS